MSANTRRGSPFKPTATAYQSSPAQLPPDVACWHCCGHDHGMGRDRIQPATPDLFSTASPGEKTSSNAKQGSSAQKRRHVLPKHLPNAVKYLTDRELDLLITASLEEAKRRGRPPPSVQANTPDEPVSNRSSARNKQQADLATVSLPRGQINAVRAAFKAGITPSRIARQFGISQSDVRKALAPDQGR